MNKDWYKGFAVGLSIGIIAFVVVEIWMVII